MQRQNLSLHSSAFHHIYEIKSVKPFPAGISRIGLK